MSDMVPVHWTDFHVQLERHFEEIVALIGWPLCAFLEQFGEMQNHYYECHYYTAKELNLCGKAFLYLQLS